MKLDNKQQRPFWLPFLVWGYIETIRRATFFAFGWAGQGQALFVASLLAAFLAYTVYVSPSRTRKVVFVCISLLNAGLVWVVNKSEIAGQESGFLLRLFGLPRIDLGSISPSHYATYCLLIVVIYGLMVFMVTSFIMERKSMTEVFWAGTILLVIEIITFNAGILIYVAVNAVISIVLRGQLNLMEMESDPRVRLIRGSGFRTGILAGKSVVLALIITTTALVLPAGKQKTDFNIMSTALINKIISQQFQKSGDSGAFELFWSKMENFELQGEVKVNNYPVMFVKSPEPAYWKGESADLYTGTGWKNTMTPMNVQGNELENPYSPEVDVRKVEQVFSFAARMSSQVVFSSGAPAFVDISGARLTRDQGGNLFTDNVRPGITYKLEAYLPEDNVGRLRMSGRNYPSDIKAYYLQLPERVPQRVRQFTEKLTAEFKSPYEKAKVIEKYLAKNYPYDLAISPVPNNRDVVDYFLFDLKRGYCTYHSTAMVVMLRSVGIPARWVKGFITGNLNQNSGVYEVTMSEAHAWVEVYFQDFGWVPFEPTSTFVLPTVKPESGIEKASMKENADVLPVTTASPTEILQRGKKISPWKVVIPGLAVIAAALLVYLWRIRKMFRLGYGDKIRDTYISLLDLLAYKGFHKNAAQTPMEFANGLADKIPAAYEDILCITDAYLRDKYGKGELTGEEVEKVRAVFKNLADKWLGRTRD